MRRSVRLYLETSFWRRLLDQADPERRRITHAFLVKVARRSEVRISRIVHAEINEIRDLDLRHRLQRKIADEKTRTITSGAHADRRVVELLRARAVGPGHLADLYHIGYSIVGRCDYLVTWDEDDLARPWTQRAVDEYCRRAGLKRLRIGTPLEVAERWLGVRMP